jgi:hypothetical protein
VRNLPGQPEEPAEQQRTGDDVADVLARDGEQVVQAGCSETLAQLIVQTLVFAENDPGHDRPPFAVETTRQGARDRSPHAVGDAPEPTAPADDDEALRAEDDLYASLLQIGGLVEAAAVLYRAWPAHGGDELDHGALRGSAADRKLEPRRLLHDQPVEANDLNGNTKRERARPRWARHLHACECSTADVRDEDRAVQVGEPEASPPAAGDEQGRGEERCPLLARAERNSGEEESDEHRQETGEAKHQRGGQARAEGAGEQVWRRDPNRGVQSSTSGFRSARRAGPIPGTASSSSTDWNAPCSAR